MIYTQTRQGNDVIMPFLMGCTSPEKITLLKETNEFGYYNHMTQLTGFHMATPVGTRSLKVSRTAIPGKPFPSYSKEDKKNEIDDKKYV